jgi:hypothetical protein
VDDKENRKDGFVSTVDICERLNGDGEAPWQRNKDKMTPELLARILRPYRIKSERRTLEEKKVRGLSWEKLQPIFSRWL